MNDEPADELTIDVIEGSSPHGRVAVQRLENGCRIRLKAVPVSDTLGCLAPSVVSVCAVVALGVLMKAELEAMTRGKAAMVRIGAFSVAWLLSLQLWSLLSRRGKLKLVARAASTGQNGCLLILCTLIAAGMAAAALTGELTVKWDDPWEIVALVAIPMFVTFAAAWCVRSMSRETVFEAVDRTLSVTSGSARRPVRRSWHAASIRALGVHRGRGRDDNTRLEMVLRGDVKQVLCVDESSLDLALVASLLRGTLGVPEDAPHEATDHSDNAALSTPERLPRGEASRLVIEEFSRHVSYRLKRSSGSQLGWAVVLMLTGGASAWYWADHMPGRWDEPVGGWWMIGFTCFGLLTLATLLGVVVWVWTLLYREHFELTGHTLTRHRRLAGWRWHQSWELGEASSLDLYTEKQSAAVRIMVTIDDYQHGLAQWSWPASARDWVEDMSRRTGVPIRRLDSDASYDL